MSSSYLSERLWSQVGYSFKNQGAIDLDKRSISSYFKDRPIDLDNGSIFAYYGAAVAFLTAVVVIGSYLA